MPLAESLVYTASIWVFPILVAITLHEAAHGFVAWRLGDDTAYRLGRVTFNPLRHVDLLGTILFPAMLIVISPFVFGWAKPVPVSTAKLARPRRDLVLVALAGPAINLLLAMASGWMLRWTYLLPATAEAWVADMLNISIWINVLLAVLNMLPLPPLDGGRVLVGILPGPLAMPLARLERAGIVTLVALLLLLPILARSLDIDTHLITAVVLEPARLLQSFIALVAGIR